MTRIIEKVETAISLVFGGMSIPSPPPKYG